ncbi:ATP-grasp domain-containing protein [Micromonospora aurantiaca]|uniref:ATP-grasp domain-containing protein n=1 Tax=Micromonospora aurantiaca (nom. illeg.) TaxID=47850 RepID=UPI0033A4A176
MNVLVLGRAEDSLDYVRYCEARGFKPTFVEPGSLAGVVRNSWQQAVLASLGEAAKIRDFDDIISFRDGYQVHAELLRAARGLPAKDFDAINCLTDKTLFKSHVAVRDLVVRHIELPLHTAVDDALRQVEAALRFPVVLKPSNGFYSAGVIRVDHPAQFRRALVSVKRVCGLLRDSRGPSQVIVEEYLDGEEVMVDGFVVDGTVRSLLFHRKLPRITGVPSFHETGCVTQPFDEEKGAEFSAMLQQITRGVGLANSPYNAEFRYDGEGRLHVLEVAPRISGGGASMQNLLRICTGLDAYGIQHRLGRRQVTFDRTVERAALEYDFCAERNGHVKNIEKTVAACRDLGADTILQYRTNGQYVFAPPLNVETVLTAYFACGSSAEAEELLDVVKKRCVVETEPA